MMSETAGNSQVEGGEGYYLQGSILPFIKIPQVFISTTLYQQRKEFPIKNFSALSYQIDVPGITGHGISRHIISKPEKKFPYFSVILKAIPDDFDKSTFDPRDLSAPNGTYYSLLSQAQLQKRTNLGQFTPIEDQDLKKNSIGAKSHSELNLVYQGVKEEVNGLMCLKAKFALKDSSKTIVPVSHNDIYEVFSSNQSLHTLTCLVSPFQEDDGFARVVVIPYSEEGSVIKPGDILGTAKIVQAGDLQRIWAKSGTTSTILTTIWTDSAPTFMTKEYFEESFKEEEEKKVKGNKSEMALLTKKRKVDAQAKNWELKKERRRLKKVESLQIEAKNGTLIRGGWNKLNSLENPRQRTKEEWQLQNPEAHNRKTKETEEKKKKHDEMIRQMKEKRYQELLEGERNGTLSKNTRHKLANIRKRMRKEEEKKKEEKI